MPRPSEPPDASDDLIRLVPLWPFEIADRSLSGRQCLVARLRDALRSERLRGIAGDWTYDLARHAALLAAYRIERDELRALQNKNGPPHCLRPPVLRAPPDR